jgi:hypothetical protein
MNEINADDAYATTAINEGCTFFIYAPALSAMVPPQPHITLSHFHVDAECARLRL